MANPEMAFQGQRENMLPRIDRFGHPSLSPADPFATHGHPLQESGLIASSSDRNLLCMPAIKIPKRRLQRSFDFV
jgi:hypothetical protein